MRNLGYPLRVWIEAAIGAGISIALHFFSVFPFIFLFLIPLQILRVRHGLKIFNYTALTAFIITALIHFSTGSSSEPELIFIIKLSQYISILLLFGLWLINQDETLQVTKQNLLLIATLISGTSGIFLLNASMKNPENIQSLQQLVYVFEDTCLTQIGDMEFCKVFFSNFSRTIVKWFPRFNILAYVLFLLSGWWVGNRLGALSIRTPLQGNLLYFRVNSWSLWVLLVSASILVINIFKDMGVYSNITYNLIGIFLFLYLLQGIGILRWLFLKYRVSRIMRIGINSVIFFMLFGEITQFITLLGLPLVGLSETWLDFGRPKSPNGYIADTDSDSLKE